MKTLSANWKKPLLAFTALLSGTLGCLSWAQAQPVVIFEDDFNDYETGSLAGQGNWELRGGSDYGPQVFENIAGTEGPMVAGPAEAGATGIIAAENVAETPFGLGPKEAVPSSEFRVSRWKQQGTRNTKRETSLRTEFEGSR